MKGFFIIVSLMVSLSVSAQMNFENPDWNTVLAKAKKENKIIFVEGYASWCAPCKWMAANVFSDPTVGSFYNRHFINVKFDIESVEAADFVSKYGSLGVPTLYYIDGDGQLLHQIRGAAKSAKFIEIGKDALNPNKQLETLKRKYESGNYTDRDLKNYMDALVKTGKENNDDVLEKYLKGKNLDNTDIMRTIFMNTAPTLDSKYFSEIVSKQKKYISLFGKSTVLSKLQSAAINDGESSGIDPTNQNALQKHFAQYFNDKDLQFMVDKTYLENLMYSDDEANKILLVYEAQAILESKPDFGSDFYEDIARRFLDIYTDESALNSALQWTDIAIDQSPTYRSLVTKATLLSKLNRPEEARKYASKAMDLGRAAGRNTFEAQELLEKFSR